MTAALYSLTLRTQGLRWRVLLPIVAGVLAIVVSAAIRSGSDQPLLDITDFLTVYGFAIYVPVASLVIASAVFGDMVEDETLVYVWLRPVSRWALVVGPYAAALTIALPVVVVPLGLAAAVSGDSDLVAGAVLAAVIGVIAYSALFLAMGLRIKRALLWGLAYIVVLEGFVGSIGGLGSQFAIRAYTSSILAEFTDSDIRIGDDSLLVGVLVPLLAAAALAVYTTYRLRRMDVA